MYKRLIGEYSFKKTGQLMKRCINGLPFRLINEPFRLDS